MRHSAFFFLVVSLLIPVGVYAEETTPANETPTETIATITEAIPPVLTTTETDPAEVVATAPVVTEEAATDKTDNLEFISGEVGELDEAGKTITVKLYGETESTTTDKTLKVSVDESTDITDGEQDRDLKSINVGTELDVEYDPATNKATYIFVY